jgi:hypothetical protein
MCVYLLFVIPHIVFGFGLQGGTIGIGISMIENISVLKLSAVCMLHTDRYRRKKKQVDINHTKKQTSYAQFFTFGNATGSKKNGINALN